MAATTNLRRARSAVVFAFFANGFMYSSLISRVPSVATTLELSTGQLGLLLWCLSAGAVSGLPLAGPLVHRFAPARAVLASSWVVTAGLVTFTVALLGGPVLMSAVGLYLTGLGMGVWEVSMNVSGADVAQRLCSISLMTRLHAALSLGTVGGAAVGAVCATLEVSLAVQIAGVVAVLPVAMIIVVRSFVAPVAVGGRSAGGGLLAAWREPRTLLIGLLVLAFAFTEGSANEWIAYALTDGYAAGEGVGAVGFALFVTAMTAGRLFGGVLLARFGRVTVLRASAGIAFVGLLMVIIGGTIPIALTGAFLWGSGASLGFPVGMSAAADDPSRAAARVSVVSSVGYTAFLAGPPLIGLVGDQLGILRALSMVMAALLLGCLVSGAVRPLAPHDHEVPAGP